MVTTMNGEIVSQTVISPPPRVVTNTTSMAHAAEQSARRAANHVYTGEPLRIFDKVPAWAIAHALTDDSIAPLLRRGEVAVVESHHGRAGWLPQEGELFLIEYASPPTPVERYERRTRAVIMPRQIKGRWWAGPLRTFAAGTIHMSDGPYADEAAMAEKLIGKVVGIYQPGLGGNGVDAAHLANAPHVRSTALPAAPFGIGWCGSPQHSEETAA